MADKLLLVTTFIVLTVPTIPLTNHLPAWLTILVISRDVVIVVVVAIVNLAVGPRTFTPSLLGKLTTATFILTSIAVMFYNYRERGVGGRDDRHLAVAGADAGLERRLRVPDAPADRRHPLVTAVDGVRCRRRSAHLIVVAGHAVYVGRDGERARRPTATGCWSRSRAASRRSTSSTFAAASSSRPPSLRVAAGVLRRSDARDGGAVVRGARLPGAGRQLRVVVERLEVAERATDRGVRARLVREPAVRSLPLQGVRRALSGHGHRGVVGVQGRAVRSPPRDAAVAGVAVPLLRRQRARTTWTALAAGESATVEAFRQRPVRHRRRAGGRSARRATPSAAVRRTRSVVPRSPRCSGIAARSGSREACHGELAATRQRPACVAGSSEAACVLEQLRRGRPAKRRALSRAPVQSPASTLALK